MKTSFSWNVTPYILLEFYRLLESLLVTDILSYAAALFNFTLVLF